ncbi:hypothetical protein ACOME3_002151 [Neoechinorhynchus agilis]
MIVKMTLLIRYLEYSHVAMFFHLENRRIYPTRQTMSQYSVLSILISSYSESSALYNILSLCFIYHQYTVNLHLMLNENGVENAVGTGNVPLPTVNYTCAIENVQTSISTVQVPSNVVPKKGRRKNPWGFKSYAEMIEEAILTSADKRLRLAQIYDWIIKNVPFFKDKTDKVRSKAWKNSIRHNLSLRAIFRRVKNEGSSKSSWWILDRENQTNRVQPTRRKRLKHGPSTNKNGTQPPIVPHYTPQLEHFVEGSVQMDNIVPNNPAFEPIVFPHETNAYDNTIPYSRDQSITQFLPFQQCATQLITETISQHCTNSEQQFDFPVMINRNPIEMMNYPHRNLATVQPPIPTIPGGSGHENPYLFKQNNAAQQYGMPGNTSMLQTIQDHYPTYRRPRVEQNLFPFYQDYTTMEQCNENPNAQFNGYDQIVNYGTEFNFDHCDNFTNYYEPQWMEQNASLGRPSSLDEFYGSSEGKKRKMN